MRETSMTSSMGCMSSRGGVHKTSVRVKRTGLATITKAPSEATGYNSRHGWYFKASFAGEIGCEGS